MLKIRSYRETGQRYPILRFLATTCNVVGVLLLAGSGLLIVAGVSSYLAGSNRLIGSAFYLGAAIVWSIGLFFSGIQSLAMGSFFQLAIHVEENTRATAQALERLLQSNVDLKPEIDPRSIFLS